MLVALSAAGQICLMSDVEREAWPHAYRFFRNIVKIYEADKIGWKNFRQYTRNKLQLILCPEIKDPKVKLAFHQYKCDRTWRSMGDESTYPFDGYEDYEDCKDWCDADVVYTGQSEKEI